MGETFFTADWHLGDERLAAGLQGSSMLGRPFVDIEDMYENILANHNAVVAPEDTVYIIGDAFYKRAQVGVELLEAFNGQLILIRGNHDILPDETYAPYIEQIFANGAGLELDVDGVSCWLTHYPTLARPDRFNLVGHIHASWRLQKNMLNVGVDAQHFRPLSAAQVRMQYDILCNDYDGIIYDGDVWCGQHPANIAHEDRGILGSYFKG